MYCDTPKALVGLKRHLTFVTRSARTQHNPASLNLQYKALNTMGEILVYY